MKIVHIGENLINLDSVSHINIQSKTLIMNNLEKIFLTEDELEQFVFEYNLYDTDTSKLLLERLARVVTSNPEYLTKEGIQEQITIKVKYHKLEDYFKELSGGVKLKQMPLNKLLSVYKEITEKVKEIDDNSAF